MKGFRIDDVFTTAVSNQEFSLRMMKPPRITRCCDEIIGCHRCYRTLTLRVRVESELFAMIRQACWLLVTLDGSDLLPYQDSRLGKCGLYLEYLIFVPPHFIHVNPPFLIHISPPSIQAVRFREVSLRVTRVSLGKFLLQPAAPRWCVTDLQCAVLVE